MKNLAYQLNDAIPSISILDKAERQTRMIRSAAYFLASQVAVLFIFALVQS